MGGDQQTPTKASIPPWALNPDYEVHATTRKPQEVEHRPVFDLFTNNDRKDSSENLAIPSNIESSKASRTASEPPNSKRNSTNSTTTKL